MAVMVVAAHPGIAGRAEEAEERGGQAVEPLGAGENPFAAFQFAVQRRHGAGQGRVILLEEDAEGTRAKEERALDLHRTPRAIELDARRFQHVLVDEFQDTNAIQYTWIRLLTGGLRAVTGLIARSNNRQFQVNTAVATIGVRGTGFDVLCTDACSDTGAPQETDAPGGLSLANWQGCNVVANDQGEATACEGQALNVASPGAAPRPLDKVPPYFERNSTPRPDKLKVDLDYLFGLQQETFAEAGAYVQVREGTVTLKGASTELFTLAKGETGYVDPSGQKFIRLGVTPVFLDRDVFTRDGEPDDYGCFVK
jgi:hypothetical protein